MAAIIKKEMLPLFTPEFHTAINEQAVRITQDEARTNWAKYIFTPAAVLYQNLDELRKKYNAKKGIGKAKPVKLDMKTQQRGTVFGENKKRAEEIAAFHKRQAKNVERMKARKEASQAKTKKK